MLTSAKDKLILTEEQKLMYSNEKVTNFRLISRQFAELAYNVIPVATAFQNLPVLVEPGLPLEGYRALLPARLLNSFVGTTAHLPGFVAYREDTGQLIVAISGTNVDSALQALYNIHALRHPHPSKRGKIHSGFWKLYKGIRTPCLAGLRDALTELNGRISEVVITGHSMGSAISQLLVLDILHDESLLPLGNAPLHFVGFGGPRVGTEGLVNFWSELVGKRQKQHGNKSFAEFAVKMHNDGQTIYD
ncbi:Triacylglycerol lipase [Mycena indigotica]|uniref:Triacylglycerol lipase n=1 Tax=Mycena indigotica TaxID=2126181 RepID=A0A8H6SU98_9AGAR|nr:Triacylglycerol lipase [Mycena indigotica]KAF7306290.1 Triacylglycerol lipase [Mycena indigotica]